MITLRSMESSLDTSQPASLGLSRSFHPRKCTMLLTCLDDWGISLSPRDVGSFDTSQSSSGISPRSADYVRQGDFNSTVDQNGPLLPGWERRLDPLGRTCFVDYNTRMTTWNKPCPNQSINHVVQDSETNAARDLRFRRLPVDYMVDVANAQATTHPTPSTTALPSAVTTAIAAGYNDWLWQSSNRVEERYTSEGRLYCVDHSTRTTAWLHPRRRTVRDKDSNILLSQSIVLRMGDSSYFHHAPCLFCGPEHE